MDLHENG